MPSVKIKIFWVTFDFERTCIKRSGDGSFIVTLTPKLPLLFCSIKSSDNYVNTKACSRHRQSHSSVKWKIILKVPLRLFFRFLTLLLGIEKSAKCTYFATRCLLPAIPKYLQPSSIINAIRNFGVFLM